MAQADIHPTTFEVERMAALLAAGDVNGAVSLAVSGAPAKIEETMHDNTHRKAIPITFARPPFDKGDYAIVAPVRDFEGNGVYVIFEGDELIVDVVQADHRLTVYPGDIRSPAFQRVFGRHPKTGFRVTRDRFRRDVVGKVVGRFVSLED